MEEQELAERCRQGDNLARKELYERYAGRMLSVCLRYAGDRETAQDLMHDGFLKLLILSISSLGGERVLCGHGWNA